MRFASALSTRGDWRDAVAEAAADLRAGLDGTRPDLLLAFASAHHTEAWPRLGEALRREVPEALLLGCSAHSVIGAGREVEDGPGLALAAAALPGVELTPFRAEVAPFPEPSLPDDASFLLLADPFTCDAEALVAHLDARHPTGTKVGGLASGAARPGENVLWLGDEVLEAGCAGLALTGPLRVGSLVAQGCRPVGTPLFVTHCRENVLLEVDGRPPLEVLNELYASSDAREQALFRHALFLGLEMRAEQHEYGRGDFLVRNLMGVDRKSGALHVAAPLRERQVVQFHLRDAHTADLDLRERLDACAAGEEPPAGALLFSCLGRGRGLYGAGDHDSGLFRERVGDVPLAGFFCNGEIGPVEGRTFLHGYTSAFALFRPAAAPATPPAGG